MSNKETKKEHKTEGKKIVKFIIGLVALYAVGFVVGVGSAMAEDMLRSESLTGAIERMFSIAVPVVYVAVNIIMFIAGMIIYFKAKKMADNWDGEDEDIPDIIEKKLNKVTVAYNIVTVCNCFFFGALVEIAEVAKGAEVNLPFSTFVTTSFFVFFAFNFVIAKLTIDLIKRLNPERNSVSVFEKNFQKQWEDSSDEAQKQILYKAAYAAYKVTNMVCVVMWGITLFAQLIYKTGVFPMACVCIIWATLIGVNSVVSAKLEAGSEKLS